MAYTAWAASTSYAVGAIRRATTVQDFGLVFQCTTAGTSGSTQPAWPTLIGGTTQDGSVVWTAISAVYEDLSVLAPNAIVELFQLHLDATLHGSADIYYFHNGVNANVTGNVVWNGQSYVRLPLEATGFDYSSSGSLPRPKLAVSNIGSSITALLLQVNLITTGNDLGGAKVVRIRTLKKYLDGETAADPNAKFPDEIWYVDRKSNENRAVVEFELASKFDLVGVMLPRRQIIANVCQWEYQGGECGYYPATPASRPLREHYAGFGYYESRSINASGLFNAAYYLGAYADLVAAGYTLANVNEHFQNFGIWEGRNGNAGGPFDMTYYWSTYPDLNVLVYKDQNDQGVSSSNLDVCGKRISSCKARFGATAELPFGSFPGAGLAR